MAHGHLVEDADINVKVGERVVHGTDVWPGLTAAALKNTHMGKIGVTAQNDMGLYRGDPFAMTILLYAEILITILDPYSGKIQILALRDGVKVGLPKTAETIAHLPKAI